MIFLVFVGLFFLAVQNQKHNSYKVEGDPRLLVVCRLFVEIEGRAPYEFDLSSPEKLAALKTTKIVMKEGAVYNFKIEFKVQNDLVSGLKYSSVFYKGGVLPVAHDNHMVGSYAPSPTNVYSWSSPPMMAPTGMLARGLYKGKSRFVDDDGQLHLEYEFLIDIKKEWA